MSEYQEMIDRANEATATGTLEQCEAVKKELFSNEVNVFIFFFLFFSLVSVFTMLRVHLWVETAVVGLVPSFLRRGYTFVYERKKNYEVEQHISHLLTLNFLFDIAFFGYIFTMFGWRTFVVFYAFVFVLSPFACNVVYRTWLLDRRIKKLKRNKSL